MMDKNLAKLSSEIGKSDAELLVKAGFRSPHLIKLATNEQLLAVPGIGLATLRRIRKMYPRLE